MSSCATRRASSATARATAPSGRSSRVGARLLQVGEDPLGETPSRDISKKKLDKLLVEGDPEAGIIQGAIEEFAQELATVIRRFLRLKGWRDTERIAIGGGLREGRIGELAVGRAAVLLKATGVDVALVPIGHHPDEAGLIGAAHLARAWIFSGHDCLVGVDIGGTNIRAGIVLTNQKKMPDLSKAEVWKFDTKAWLEPRWQGLRGRETQTLISTHVLIRKLIQDVGHPRPPEHSRRPSEAPSCRSSPPVAAQPS